MISLFGLWVNDLPLDVRCMVHNDFRSMLAGCFTSHHSGLHRIPEVQSVIGGLNLDGYEIYLDLARLAGHPLLQSDASQIVFPTQSSTQTLLNYTSACMHCALQSALSGVYFSDRYFVDLLLQGIHPSVPSSIVDEFKSRMLHRHPHIEQALGSDFTPRRISMLLASCAKAKNHLNVMTTSPQSLARASRAVQALDLDDAAPSEDAEIAALHDDRRCNICKKPGHLHAQCPTVETILADPRICDLLLKKLQAAVSNKDARRDRRSKSRRDRRVSIQELATDDTADAASDSDSSDEASTDFP